MSTMTSIGMRALFATQAQLNTTAHNIANASVEGYSRQSVVLSTSTPRYGGVGYWGQGVDVVAVQRAHSDFTTQQAAQARSAYAMESTRYQQLDRLQDAFPPGDQGLGHAMGEFFSALSDLATVPADASARQVVLARASDVSARFNYTAGQIDTLQQEVWADLRTSAGTVNGLAQQIGDLNSQILRLQSTGQTPNDLLDRREAVVAQLGEYAEVSTVESADGSFGVYIGGSQCLVLGEQVSQLKVVGDPADPSRASLALQSGSTTAALSQNDLTGGSMAALVQFQNEDLVDARNLVGQMAVALAGAVNQAQAQGLDLRDPAQAGQPLFSLGAPEVMAHASNDPGAEVSVAIADASQVQASDYGLRLADAGSGGTYELTRLSDGTRFYVDSGDTVDGLTVTVGPAGLQPGDSFVLKPLSLAASGMQRALDDPDGLAAALPQTVVLDPDNKGTATVAELSVSGAIDDSLSTVVTFNTDPATGKFNGTYTWSLNDRDTGAPISGGTKAWTAGEAITVNGMSIVLNGLPAGGDALTMTRTVHPEANNGNALVLSGLAEKALVGRTTLSTGAVGAGATFTDAYAAAMADVGVRAQSAGAMADVADTAREQTTALLGAQSGVNLDEEAAKLIQFQQAYQAAAKVLQVAQSVFDTVLDMAR
ncbi:flagellar hook-associated protein FlgK [Ideonella livida]|uniref:Flagellar hook-associated protein 1 n=1 Tax=Ideonella livida TaxID=2707176 RepID=A0A7C9PEX3_9BURK|nr:flagellar hook-associated protein FlgK [Ideonella livida]NDY89948.1 flagellar hook-associated protein FlgK [Ideonella livida]